MKLFILLVALTYTQARYTFHECDGITVRGVKQQGEVLKTGVTSPYQLALDYDTNILYFSYSVETDEVFKSALLNLKTNEFRNIPGIAGGFANAVDRKRNVVYLGGRDGIYQYNPDANKAEHLHITNDNIWQLFYKDELYYSRYPDEKAYVLRDKKFTMVPELKNTKAFLLAVDNYDNIYYSNSSGLFTYTKANGRIFNIGEFNVNGFALDINNNLYFSTPEGIYYVNVEAKKIENIAKFDNIFGLAVESDGNIIYASEDSIIRLVPTKTICPDAETSVYPMPY